MGFLAGKKVLIVGLISNRSIAYGIAEACFKQGASLAFTYQNEKLKERVETLAKDFSAEFIEACDVASDSEIDSLFEKLKNHWGTFDVLVHSVAFAPADQIKGDYIENASREGFRIAHDVSSYSLVALAKAALPLMKDSKGSILTLSYYGSEKAVPNYNVMGIAKASLEAAVRYLAVSVGKYGIRVNAISAGPLKTLAAAGIHNFRKIQEAYSKVVPLGRNITLEEVGNTAAFLASDLSSGITGEVIHVDAGFHAVSSADID